MKLSPKQTRALEIIAEMRYYPTLVKEEDGWYARWRAISEDNDWVDEYVRASAMTRLSEDAENDRHESLHDAWIMALRSRTGLVVWDDGECAAFAAELENWSGTAAEDKAARAETEFEFRPFEITVAIPHGRRALRALGESMFIFPPLGGLKRHGKCLRIELTRTEAESFIRSGAYELRESGYAVKGVDIAVPVTFDADITETAEGSRKFVARLKVKVAGEEVTAEEIRFLLDPGRHTEGGTDEKTGAGFSAKFDLFQLAREFFIRYAEEKSVHKRNQRAVCRRVIDGRAEYESVGFLGFFRIITCFSQHSKRLSVGLYFQLFFRITHGCGRGLLWVLFPGACKLLCKRSE